MKKLPEVNVSYGDLYRILIAQIRSKLLLTGIELKVFNQLSDPRSVDAVAQAIGTHRENTRVFLDSLAAMDLLQKKNGLYQNTPITQAFLVEGSQTYLGQLFAFMARANSLLENLSKLVKEGSPETSPFSQEMFLEEASMMAHSERAGDAQLVAAVVAKLPEFQSLRKMLDLGGGPGLIGMAIVAVHPSMKGVVFDLPPVVNIAQTFIKEYDMADRMDVLGGDFNRDSIGDGYDLILASGSLQFAKDIDSVVEKVYDALTPTGVFVSIFPCGLTHEQTKPEIHVLGMLLWTLMGQDVEFYQGYIADSMLRVGFKSVRSRTFNTHWGPMDLDIGRK